jgi:alpha-tubulin suppressor-like RCC1 family protein
VLKGGKVQCWGWNDLGQLGNGYAGDVTPKAAFYTIPQNVIGSDGTPLSGVVSVAAGNEHTCAILANSTGNTVVCWGANTLHQLGIGATGSAYTTTPVPVLDAAQSPLIGATALAAGRDQTCTVLSGGAVYCWGSNDYGQLGLGNTNSVTTAAKVGTLQALAIGTGEDQGCAAEAPSAGPPYNVLCWGRDSSGEIGAGPRDGGSGPTTPIHALVSANATIIALGWGHSCAVLVDGTIQCWGDNSYGQLGNSSTVSSSVPVTVSKLSKAISLSGGERHTCAVVTGGATYCWGSNSFGQLGSGGGNSTAPVSVAGLGP